MSDVSPWKLLARQSTIYVLVGGVVYLCDLATFMIAIWLSPEMYLVGNALGKVVGATLGFILHRRVTFSWEKRDNVLWQAGTYGALLAGNILGGSALIYIGVDVLGLPKIPVRIVLDVLIVASTFFISRHLVFRNAQSREQSANRG